MEPELRDQFMAAASSLHRPAAQIVRDLMRSCIVCQEMPNVDTISKSCREIDPLFIRLDKFYCEKFQKI
jgi:hypothetical protein